MSRCSDMSHPAERIWSRTIWSCSSTDRTGSAFLPKSLRMPRVCHRLVRRCARYALPVTHRLLLDVSSMMYRAFFAMREPGVFTKDGRPVGAVHGYLDMVTRLINDRHPDEIVHVYDHDWRPVARTDIYADYKANRLPDPPELPPQFLMLHE